MKKLSTKLCVAAAAAIISATSYSSAFAEDLTIGFSTWVGYGPLYIAQEEGFFEDEGLDVDLVKMEDVKTRMPALSAGRIDVAATTVDTVLGFTTEAHPLTYLFAVDDSSGGDGIVANKDIASVADLKGKKVAYTEGSVSQFFLGALLKDVGLKVSDVESLNMTAGDAGAAFVAGQVDAAVTWEPWLTRGKQADHGKILVDSSSTPGLITDIMVTTKEAYAKRGDDFKALYRAWSKAVAWQQANPEAADKIMAKGVGGWLEDAEVFAETRAGIVYYDSAKNESFMDPANADGIMKTIKAAAELGKEAGLFTAEVDPASMIASGVINK
ncbi:NitT/TauT family transport system substrate-binding protein [Cohaesibacter sp. ES.047]|uniref:ABC transporter substrate-binding protein n=1 Tax=Cohaesibacter sp. ES.047 TaxID=1798205 RepID=UPI000BB7163D|nr:ABC transporter substrate-binding protein [Cohaesibacter sp. ES.047]SNY94401.1 NitT/TauT family transport system substrate-binding protein [Cohaesibacter sp. ES.047]